MLEQHDVSNISFDECFMYLTVDNKEYKIDLNKTSKILLNATSQERNSYRVLHSGDGITWFPVLNEDLNIKRLIQEVS